MGAISIRWGLVAGCSLIPQCTLSSRPRYRRTYIAAYIRVSHEASVVQVLELLRLPYLVCFSVGRVFLVGVVEGRGPLELPGFRVDHFGVDDLDDDVPVGHQGHDDPVPGQSSLPVVLTFN